MLRLLLITLLALPALVLAPPALVAAHNAFPASEYDVVVGPYKYRLLLFNEKINAGDRVDILLVPADDVPAGVKLSAIANGPEGTVQTARLAPDENNGRNTALDVVVTAPGTWQLLLTADGSRGPGTATFSLPNISPTPPIPLWAGWAFALSPLLGVAWFARRQTALLRRAQAEGLDV